MELEHDWEYFGLPPKNDAGKRLLSITSLWFFNLSGWRGGGLKMTHTYKLLVSLVIDYDIAVKI